MAAPLALTRPRPLCGVLCVDNGADATISYNAAIAHVMLDVRVHIVHCSLIQEISWLNICL
jgi:hypothetical protein